MLEENFEPKVVTIVTTYVVLLGLGGCVVTMHSAEGLTTPVVVEHPDPEPFDEVGADNL